MRTLIGVLAALWSLSRHARADDKTLAEVVEQAEIAVVVELDRPTWIKVEFPVPPVAGKKCGPYPFGVWRGRVTSVVHPGKAAPIAARDPITIIPADIAMLVDLTHRECLDGTSKSPIYEHFRGASPGDGKRLLVLLSWSPDYGWIEATSGSWLDPARAPEVAKLATTRARAPSGPVLDTGGLCLRDEDCVAANHGCTKASRPPIITVAVAGRFASACRLAPDVPICAPCPSTGRHLAQCRALRCTP